MDNFKKILVDIQDLIKSSNGNLINYGKSNFIFKKRYDVSLNEINDFEKKYKVKFPNIYREFLLTVGSCTLFQDELLPGFDFLAPKELYDWSQQVFEGTDSNLFPNILITISIPRTGEQAGFLLTKENENFGVFFPDIPPEEWQEDTEFEKFEDWLDNLMKEKLEEI